MTAAKQSNARRAARAAALVVRAAALLIACASAITALYILSKALTSSVLGAPSTPDRDTVIALVVLASSIGAALELTKDHLR